MPWLGFGFIWLGYSVGFWGYCLIRGYNISGHQLINPFTPYNGTWPPAMAGNEEIIPTGDKAGLAKATLTVANITGAGAGSSVNGPAQPTGVANTATIRAAAQLHGWASGGQWNALTHVIARESGGNPTIKNSSSGALGIAQALGHGTGCTAGTLGNEYGGYGLTCKQAQAANSGNATMQLRWMMNYIKATYGTPAGAWAHEQSAGWY